MFGFFSKDHMNEVYPPNPQTNKGGLYIGDWTAADDVDTLNAKGINFVLTGLPDNIGKNEKYQTRGIIQLTCHADDMPNFDMTPHFENAHAFITNGLANGNVLVHCAAGISRSSTLCLTYLMRQRQENLEKALAFLRTKRPICTPNFGFQRQLKEYGKKHGLHSENQGTKLS